MGPVLRSSTKDASGPSRRSTPLPRASIMKSVDLGRLSVMGSLNVSDVDDIMDVDCASFVMSC